MTDLQGPITKYSINFERERTNETVSTQMLLNLAECELERELERELEQIIKGVDGACVENEDGRGAAAGVVEDEAPHTDGATITAGAAAAEAVATGATGAKDDCQEEEDGALLLADAKAQAQNIAKGTRKVRAFSPLRRMSLSSVLRLRGLRKKKQDSQKGGGDDIDGEGVAGNEELGKDLDFDGHGGEDKNGGFWDDEIHAIKSTQLLLEDGMIVPKLDTKAKPSRRIKRMAKGASSGGRSQAKKKDVRQSGTEQPHDELEEVGGFWDDDDVRRNKSTSRKLLLEDGTLLSNTPSKKKSSSIPTKAAKKKTKKNSSKKSKRGNAQQDGKTRSATGIDLSKDLKAETKKEEMNATVPVDTSSTFKMGRISSPLSLLEIISEEQSTKLIKVASNWFTPGSTSTSNNVEENRDDRNITTKERGDPFASEESKDGHEDADASREGVDNNGHVTSHVMNYVRTSSDTLAMLKEESDGWFEWAVNAGDSSDDCGTSYTDGESLVSYQTGSYTESSYDDENDGN